MRQLAGKQYRLIKSATNQLYNHFGGQTAVAGFTRVSQQTLSKYACLGDEGRDRFIPADIILDIENFAGDPIVTRALAASTDHLLVKRPRVANTESDSARELGQVAKECGEVVSTFAEVVADAHISVEEAKRVRKEATEAMSVMAALIEHMEQVLAEGEE